MVIRILVPGPISAGRILGRRKAKKRGARMAETYLERSNSITYEDNSERKLRARGSAP